MKMIYSKVLTLVMGGVIVNQNGFSSSSKTQNSQTLPQNEDTTNHLTREKVIELQRQQNHPDVFIVPDDIEVIDSQAFNKESSHQDDEQSSIPNINHIIIDQSQSNNEKLTIKPQAFLGNFNKITFRNTEKLKIEDQAFIKFPTPDDETSLPASIHTIEFQNCKSTPDNQGIQWLKDPVNIVIEDMETIPNHFCSNITIDNISISRPIQSLGNSCFYGCLLPKDFPIFDKNKIDVNEIPESAFNSVFWKDGDWTFSLEGNIPDTWKIIGPGAFAYSSLFRSLVKGSNLAEVGEGAFSSMLNLKYVLLSGKTYFGDRALAINRNLRSVAFGEGSTFGKGIFDGCCHEFIIELPEDSQVDLPSFIKGLTSDKSTGRGPIIFCPPQSYRSVS